MPKTRKNKRGGLARTSSSRPKKVLSDEEASLKTMLTEQSAFYTNLMNGDTKEAFAESVALVSKRQSSRGVTQDKVILALKNKIDDPRDLSTCHFVGRASKETPVKDIFSVCVPNETCEHTVCFSVIELNEYVGSFKMGQAIPNKFKAEIVEKFPDLAEHIQDIIEPDWVTAIQMHRHYSEVETPSVFMDISLYMVVELLKKIPGLMTLGTFFKSTFGFIFKGAYNVYEKIKNYVMANAYMWDKVILLGLILKTIFCFTNLSQDGRVSVLENLEFYLIEVERFSLQSMLYKKKLGYTTVFNSILILKFVLKCFGNPFTLNIANYLRFVKCAWGYFKKNAFSILLGSMGRLLNVLPMVVNQLEIISSSLVGKLYEKGTLIISTIFSNVGTLLNCFSDNIISGISLHSLLSCLYKFVEKTFTELSVSALTLMSFLLLLSFIKIKNVLHFISNIQVSDSVKIIRLFIESLIWENPDLVEDIMSLNIGEFIMNLFLLRVGYPVKVVLFTSLVVPNLNPLLYSLFLHYFSMAYALYSDVLRCYLFDLVHMRKPDRDPVDQPVDQYQTKLYKRANQDELRQQLNNNATGINKNNMNEAAKKGVQKFTKNIHCCYVELADYLYLREKIPNPPRRTA